MLGEINFERKLAGKVEASSDASSIILIEKSSIRKASLKNRYLSNDEADEIVERQARGETIPENIVLRSKKLHGWIGIQRYADPNDFGIDFIRNGRKILIGDKGLFSYDNPWTGMKELQYPIELGSTFGGRIVGKLHVDYLVPTYVLF